MFSRSPENQTLELQIFKFHDVIKCRSKNKYILLNNLRGKQSVNEISLLMKFGQFTSYSKGNNFIKKISKNCGLKTSSRLFLVCKELSTTLLENGIFEAIYYYQICNSKTIKISPNQHAGLLKFFFTEDPLKVQKSVWKQFPGPFF